MEFSARYDFKPHDYFTRKRFILVNTVLVFVVILLSVLQVVVLNRDSTHGVELSEINSQIVELKGEIIQLDREVASASAISNVEKQALSQGLSQGTKLVSIRVETPLAYKSP